MKNKIIDELYTLKTKSLFIIESAFIYSKINEASIKALANIISNDIAKEFDKILNAVNDKQ